MVYPFTNYLLHVYGYKTIKGGLISFDNRLEFNILDFYHMNGSIHEKSLLNVADALRFQATLLLLKLKPLIVFFLVIHMPKKVINCMT